jgi:microsomal dipeptidase-like Zn-dependent dipeptidase
MKRTVQLLALLAAAFRASADFVLQDVSVAPAGYITSTGLAGLARIESFATPANSSGFTIEVAPEPFGPQIPATPPFSITGFQSLSAAPGDPVFVLGAGLDRTIRVVIGGFSAKFTILNPTSIEVWVPPLATSGHVALLGSSGKTADSPSDLTLLLPQDPPKIASISPSSGVAGQTVHILGSGFTAANSVSLAGANSIDANFYPVSPGDLSLTLPNAPGDYIVIVKTPIGEDFSAQRITITAAPLAPVILTMDPQAGPPGTVVKLTGSNFGKTTGITVGGVTCVYFDLGDSQVSFTIPDGARSGLVALANNSGTAISANDFTVVRPVPSPKIHVIPQRSFKLGEIATLSGSDFESVTGVMVGKLQAQFKKRGGGTIDVTIPPGAVSGAVTLMGSTGTVVSSVSLLIPSPFDPPVQAPPVAPAIDASGGLTVGFMAQPNVPYGVEISSDLQNPVWQAVGHIPARPGAGNQLARVPSLSGLDGVQTRFVRVIAGALPFDNWDFEEGLNGWTVDFDPSDPGGAANAFAYQPTGGEACFKRSTPSDDLATLIGGNYWDTPIHLGHHGDFWIGTGFNHPDPTQPPQGDPSTLDGNVGAITSPTFQLTQPYISFLIGGYFQPGIPQAQRPRVELQIKPNTDLEWLALRAGGALELTNRWFVLNSGYPRTTDKEMFRREVWNVSAFTNHLARIVLRDPTPVGHLNADDFRFLDEDPTSSLIAVGEIYRDPDQPVWGFADTHTHPAANLGFGGDLIAGSAIGDPSDALRSCEYAHGPGGSNTSNRDDPGGCLFFGLCAPSVIMDTLVQFGGHATGGYEYGFDGWPNVLEQGVHIQMHEQWIRRAWQGGLRLMVAHAVNTKLLGDLDFHNGDTGDWSNTASQITEIKRLVAHNADFMEIALTPRDARRIIHNGKLAVILGLELDQPLGMEANTPPPPNVISNRLDYAFTNLNVRHMFALHLADNAVGGAPMYNSLWNYNSWWLNNWYMSPDVSPPAEFQYHFEANGGLQFLAFLVGVAAFPPPSGYPDTPWINARQLQPPGTTFVEGMMRRGMILDFDHLGYNTKIGVLSLCETHNYPVVSGHSGFVELALRSDETSDKEKYVAEDGIPPEFIPRLTALGSLVAPVTLAKDLHNWGPVPNDLPGSAKTWIQSYYYALSHFGGGNVALGTDFTLIHGSSPRFGLKAGFVLKDDNQRKGSWRGDVLAQANGVRYAEPLGDYRHLRFEGPAEGDDLTTHGYTTEEREIWEAIAMYRAGADPDASTTYPGPRTDRIRNIARGLFSPTSDAMYGRINALGILAGNAPFEIRAGSYIRRGITDYSADAAGLSPGDRATLDRLYSEVGLIWNRWAAMDGDNPPLHRCMMNCILDADRGKPYVKEWDFNLDGFAHYGLLPDFLQDVRNCGVSAVDLKPLFHSAEDYIRLWERCEANRITD